VRQFATFPNPNHALDSTSIMVIAAIVILIVMLFTGFVTLMAFSWAASDRQFENFEDASRVIFDADEREGEPTDPNLKSKSRTARS